MPDMSIEALLAGLDDEIGPSPEFDARLRRLLADELATPEPGAGTDGATPLEVVEMELTGTAENPLGRWWLAAAAAAVVVVVLGAIVLLRDGDQGAIPVADQPGLSVVGAERSFVGAELAATTIEDGGNPYWVTAGADVWVMSLEGDLTRLDRDTLEPTATLSVAESSTMALVADAVWIADTLTGEVVRVDPATASVAARIPTDIRIDPSTYRPLDVASATGPQRRLAAIGGIGADSDSVWVGDHDGRLLEIDPQTNAVVRELAVDVRPDLVEVDAEYLLVGDVGMDVMLVLDAANGEEVARVESFDRLIGVDLHDGRAYGMDAADGVVTHLDIATGATVSSEPLGPSQNIAGQPVLDAGVVASDVGVIVETDDGFSVLDPFTLAVEGQIEIPGRGGLMTIGPDGTAWIVRYTSRTLTRVEPTPTGG